MEQLKNAINLLNSVKLTMNTIPVVGIDNQDKFVGCATAVSRVADLITKYIQLQEAAAQEHQKDEEEKDVSGNG